MVIVLRLLGLILLPITLLPSLLSGEEVRPVLFILDASGSMASPFEGVSRISAARGIMEEQLASMESSVPVGLVAYGNGIEGCDSSKLYVPVGRGNRRSFAEAMRAMRPSGHTPIASSLRLVRETILPAMRNATIVLISDGAESCGGDPEAEADLIRRGYPDTRLHVIGMTVGEIDTISFRGLARQGGGKFFDVKRESEFVKAVYLSIDPDYLETEPVERTQGFVLTDLRATKKNDGSTLLSVDYYFAIAERGNFFVYLQGTNESSAMGGYGRDGDTARSSAGRAVYGQSSQRGTITLEIPESSKWESTYVQGELWKITDVPKREAVSNTLTLRP